MHRLGSYSNPANVRSTRSRHACMAAWPNRLRPRLGRWRWRGCSLRCGSRPALKSAWRLACASKPPSRWRAAPGSPHPVSFAARFPVFNPAGRSTVSAAWTGAPGRGAHPSPWWSISAMTCAPGRCGWPAEPRPAPPLGATGWVPSPGRTRRSRWCWSARGATLALPAWASEPSSDHLAQTWSTVVAWRSALPSRSVSTGQHCPGLPGYRPQTLRVKPRCSPSVPWGPRVGRDRCGQRHGLNSESARWTGSGVRVGCSGVAGRMNWPPVKMDARVIGGLSLQM